MGYQHDNASVADLPAWIVVIAVVLLCIILLAMSGSWFEPFLFMVAIGIAIIINMGTNFFLGYISDITFSIAAILQLVLSMDYSIILMNRYRQELANGGTKYDAMKRALARAIPSIASSSATTFVGLIMLVFMNFKIGLDLGIVLAKGVAISFFVIVLILPCLILAANKLILKSTLPVIPLVSGGLAKYSYKSRKFLVPAFVCLFVAFYLLQGNTKISFTLEDEDEIADVFPKTSTTVLVYDNDDTDAVSALIDKLEENSHVKSVMGFPNTFGRAYTADELVDALDSMGSLNEGGMEGLADKMDPTLLALIYYSKYGDIDSVTMSPSEFINFLVSETSEGGSLNELTDTDLSGQTDELAKFADIDTLLTPMDAAGLASFFGMSEDDVKSLLLFNQIDSGATDDTTMTLPQFTSFIKEIAADPDYSSYIDSSMLASIDTLSTFTDSSAITQGRTASNMAQVLGMDGETMGLIYTMYYASDSSFDPTSMTMYDFTAFVKQSVLTNSLLSSSIDSESASYIDTLQTFSDPSVINSSMTISELADLFGMDSDTLTQLMLASMMQGSAGDGDMSSADSSAMLGYISQMTMTPLEFVNTILQTPGIESSLGEDTLSQLTLLQTVMEGASEGKTYSSSELASILGMSESEAKIILTYHDYLNGGSSSWPLTLQQIKNYLTDNSSTFSSMMSSEETSELATAKTLIDGTLAGTSYTSSQLADMFGASSSDINQLFLVYRSMYGDISGWSLSPKEFVNFLTERVLGSTEAEGLIDASQETDLRNANTLIDAIVADNQLTAAEMAALLSPLSSDLDQDNMDLMYLFYASTRFNDPSWTFTLEDLFDYLINDIMTDSRFEGYFDTDTINDILEAQSQIESGKAQLVGQTHSILAITTDYPDESDETTEFFDWLYSELNDTMGSDWYLVGNAAMNYEMQLSFQDELQLITILTSIAIFIVVALTFRSIIIPLILVLLIQCGIYLTVTLIGWQGYSIYYLALLIVECILMGATIDYAILFTNYYRENRKKHGIREALRYAYKGSIHTILTSGLIIILVVGIVGFFFENPVIGQICTTISIGAFFATVLILFVLPGMLAALDRLTIGRKGKREDVPKDFEG
ncbi:MAG: MMPL family transporter [Eggerthellaceae bacterium]|nr:MMPL family transporter [Eggerthellaceae bacterium]